MYIEVRVQLSVVYIFNGIELLFQDSHSPFAPEHQYLCTDSHKDV